MNISRRTFLGASAGMLTASQFGTSSPVFAEEQPGLQQWAQDRIRHRTPEGLPKPSSAQLAWQDCELGMFYHFDIPIFKPGWNWRSFKNMPKVKDFNPTKLDTDQWLEAAKLMGAKYAVLVAKHCSGFLTWQSNLYPYGVKDTPWRGGKGDIVKDFVASCERYGIKPGIYASVTANGFLEVDNPGLINRGKGGDDSAQAKYVKIQEQMLEELWSRYGDLFEIWFDGGALPVDQGGPDLVPILKKYQPDAIVFQGAAGNIRWIGNERGVADYPNWATTSRQKDPERSGTPDGELWFPGECDVPIRNHEWFWNPDEDHKVYPLKSLMQMYYQSVGRNANLLLNANPNPDGLVPDADMKRYEEFGKEIQRCFGEPLAETTGKGNEVVLSFPKPKKIDHVMIMEDIAQGERIRNFTVEGQVSGDTWKVLCEGSSVGHKFIKEIANTEVNAVRLKIAKTTAEPKIRKLAVFNCKA